MKEWIKVLRAADAAARWHVHQRRKGIAAEPYISNLRTIASSPAADWSVKRRLEYIEWAKEVVTNLRGTSLWLVTARLLNGFPSEFSLIKKSARVDRRDQLRKAWEHPQEWVKKCAFRFLHPMCSRTRSKRLPLFLFERVKFHNSGFNPRRDGPCSGVASSNCE